MCLSDWSYWLHGANWAELHPLNWFQGEMVDWLARIVTVKTNPFVLPKLTKCVCSKIEVSFLFKRMTNSPSDTLVYQLIIILGVYFKLIIYGTFNAKGWLKYSRRFHYFFISISVLTFPTRIFCRGVSGFVSGCPCCVWGYGLPTCPLFVDPFFDKFILNNLICTFHRIKNIYIYI